MTMATMVVVVMVATTATTATLLLIAKTILREGRAGRRGCDRCLKGLLKKSPWMPPPCSPVTYTQEQAEPGYVVMVFLKRFFKVLGAWGWGVRDRPPAPRRRAGRQWTETRPRRP